MIEVVYEDDPVFKDGLTTYDVDGERFRIAVQTAENPNGKVILDIGAYPGTAYYYFGKFNTYYAYGLIDDEFARALDQNNICFQRSDIQWDIKFYSDADLILFQEILEHIRLPKRTLLNIYHGMKPGASLYITTNNIYYYGYIIKLILGRPIMNPLSTEDAEYPGHHRYYSCDEVKKFFEEIGAMVKVSRRRNFLPPIYCYKKQWLGILKKVLAFCLPNLYSTHIELLIQKPL